MKILHFPKSHFYERYWLTPRRSIAKYWESSRNFLKKTVDAKMKTKSTLPLCPRPTALKALPRKKDALVEQWSHKKSRMKKVKDYAHPNLYQKLRYLRSYEIAPGLQERKLRLKMMQQCDSSALGPHTGLYASSSMASSEVCLPSLGNGEPLDILGKEQ